MKIGILPAAFAIWLSLTSGGGLSVIQPGPFLDGLQEAKKQPEVVKLEGNVKLGPVTFSHINHTTKNYSIDGTGPVTCIECHHTAQPAAEIAKHPPLKTAWPADRTTTLTAELFAKEPEAAGVASCRTCHARKDEKPKLLPENPQVKVESGTALLTLTNQHAFHRNCAGCHEQVVKLRPTVKAPGTLKCLGCHKKVAAAG